MIRYYDTDINEIYHDGEDIAKSYSNEIVYRTIVLIILITSIYYYYAIYLIFNL